jgi:hypothetical protein
MLDNQRGRVSIEPHGNGIASAFISADLAFWRRRRRGLSWHLSPLKSSLVEGSLPSNAHWTQDSMPWKNQAPFRSCFEKSVVSEIDSGLSLHHFGKDGLVPPCCMDVWCQTLAVAPGWFREHRHLPHSVHRPQNRQVDDPALTRFFSRAIIVPNAC